MLILSLICLAKAEATKYCITNKESCSDTEFTVAADLSKVPAVQGNEVLVEIATTVKEDFANKFIFTVDSSASEDILTFEGISAIEFVTGGIKINQKSTLKSYEHVVLKFKSEVALTGTEANPFGGNKILVMIENPITFTETGNLGVSPVTQIQFEEKPGAADTISVTFPWKSDIYKYFDVKPDSKVELHVPSFYCIGTKCIPEKVTSTPAYSKVGKDIDAFTWDTFKDNDEVFINKDGVEISAGGEIKAITLKGNKGIKIKDIETLEISANLKINTKLIIDQSYVLLKLIPKSNKLELTGAGGFGDAEVKTEIILTEDIYITAAETFGTLTNFIYLSTASLTKVFVFSKEATLGNVLKSKTNDKIELKQATLNCIGKTQKSCNEVKADRVYWLYQDWKTFIKDTTPATDVYIADAIELTHSDLSTFSEKIYQSKTNGITISGVDSIEINADGIKIDECHIYQGKMTIKTTEKPIKFSYVHTKNPTSSTTDLFFATVVFTAPTIFTTLTFSITKDEVKNDLINLQGSPTELIHNFDDYEDFKNNFKVDKCTFSKQTTVEICSKTPNNNANDATCTPAQFLESWDASKIKNGNKVIIHLKECLIDIKDYNSLQVEMKGPTLTVGNANSITFTKANEIALGTNIINIAAVATMTNVLLDDANQNQIFFKAEVTLAYTSPITFVAQNKVIRLDYTLIKEAITGGKIKIGAKTDLVTKVAVKKGQMTYNMFPADNGVTLFEEPEPYYCIAETISNCNEKNGFEWLIKQTFTAWPKISELDSITATEIRTYLQKNEIDAASFTRSFVIKSYSKTLTPPVDGTIKVHNIGYVSYKTGDPLQIYAKSDVELTYADFKSIDIYCKESVEFAIADDPSVQATLTFNLAAPNTKLSGTFSAGTYKFEGNGIYLKPATFPNTITFGKYLKTADEDSAITVLLLCPDGTLDKCKADSGLTTVQTGAALIVELGYSPQKDSDRAKKPYYIYHSTYKTTESTPAEILKFDFNVQQFYSTEVHVFDVKTSTASAYLLADPVKLTEISFKNPSALETSDTGMKLFDGDRSISVNLDKAKAGASVTAGARLNIKSVSTKKNIPEIKIHLGEKKTTIVFDKVIKEGPKFSVINSASLQGAEVSAWAGTSSVEDLQATLAIPDAITKSYSTGTPEAPPSSPSSGLSAGAIAGIVIGCVAFVGIIVTIVVVVVMKKKKAAKINSAQA